MPVRALPLETEIVIYAWTTFRREFRWLPDGEAPQDFTGWHASMLIGQPRGIAQLELSTDNGGVRLTAAGQIVLLLTPEQTASLPTGSNLVYNLDLTDPDGFVLRFLRGRLTVVRDVEPL